MLFSILMLKMISLYFAIRYSLGETETLVQGQLWSPVGHCSVVTLTGGWSGAALRVNTVIYGCKKGQTLNHISIKQLHIDLSSSLAAGKFSRRFQLRRSPSGGTLCLDFDLWRIASWAGFQNISLARRSPLLNVNVPVTCRGWRRGLSSTLKLF